MKKLALLAIILTSPILSACVYHDHHPNGRPFEHGGFCPPGQAKKGNC